MPTRTIRQMAGITCAVWLILMLGILPFARTILAAHTEAASLAGQASARLMPAANADACCGGPVSAGGARGADPSEDPNDDERRHSRSNASCCPDGCTTCSLACCHGISALTAADPGAPVLAPAGSRVLPFECRLAAPQPSDVFHPPCS